MKFKILQVNLYITLVHYLYIIVVIRILYLLGTGLKIDDKSI